MRYYISKSTDLSVSVETTMTLDQAFLRVGELSKRPTFYGSVYVAWHWEEVDGENKKRVRAFGQAGRSRWARPCPKSANEHGTHYGCFTCGGLGLIEDVIQ